MDIPRYEVMRRLPTQNSIQMDKSIPDILTVWMGGFPILIYHKSHKNTPSMGCKSPTHGAVSSFLFDKTIQQSLNLNMPLTADKRLSAKEILGNKKKLTQWQDSFWRHMVKKYPELEHGESASLTGRTHIPPRIYKEAVRLGKQQQMLMALLSDIHPLNAKK